MQYRITFRQEVFIEAGSYDEAQDLWERIDVGALDLELKHGNKPGEGSAIVRDIGYVETCSFEEYDE